MPWSRSNSYDMVHSGHSNPNRRLQRTESRVDKLKRQVSQGASTWLGLEQDQSSTIWLQRRAAFHGSSLVMGSGKQEKFKAKLDKECQDEEMAAPTPRDPLHKPGTAYRPQQVDLDDVDLAGRPSLSSVFTRASAGTRRKLHKKDSVAKMALDGISQVLGFKGPNKPHNRIYSVQSRTKAPGSLGPSELHDSETLLSQLPPETISEENDLDDDVFFDNKSHGTSAVDLSAGEPLQLIKPEISTTLRSVPVHGGWGRPVEKKPIPDTPAPEDEPDFVFPTRIMEKVTETVLEKPEKRRLGEGIIGQLFQRTLKEDHGVKDQLDSLSDHRPYFTYWVTFVQLVIFIVSVSVYGFAPIGFGKKIESQDVLVTALYPKTIGFEEPENFWIGPRQVDLIHLGAKFAPCMRKDPNIDDLHKDIRKNEAETACCIYTDNSGCYQSKSSDCNLLRAEWKKWDGNYSGGDRTSGTVCNQDPRWCSHPRGFDWPDDITKWPVCTQNDNRTAVAGIDDHMSCDVLSRPCCIGVKGECQLLTEEHCKAKHGYFHPNATLCSQVKCLGKVCGLIDFINEDHPDQFYRLWLSLFLHAGVFHLMLTILFQFLIMRDMEKLAGAVRTSIIYFGAGIGGNLASAIFLPYHVEVGPAGSQFGILSTLWVEVIQSWQLIHTPGKALAKLSGFTAALFLLGLLPWIDNYAHIFGFLFGLGISFAILPYITFGSKDRRRKLIICIICIILVIITYCVLFVVFYVTPITECEGCKYINCVPFKADFCENMGVSIEATETKFEWEYLRSKPSK